MLQEELEETVTNMLLDCKDEIFTMLKKQYLQSTVVSREFTGRGFFTTFSVPNELSINNISGIIGDVQATLEGNPNETYMFILFIRDGKVDTLEGVSFYNWDFEYDKLNFMYAFDNRRDYDLS